MRALRALIVVAAVTVAGCSPVEPHLYNPAEFNREASTFKHPPEDIDQAVVCYNKRGTTPAAVRKMGEDECARFNKVARYDHQELLVCSLRAPSAAYFTCLPPADARAPGGEGAAGGASGRGGTDGDGGEAPWNAPWKGPLPPMP